MTTHRTTRPFTVALVGADGAGKTTVARSLPAILPFPAAYLYMGVAPASSNYALPTTRLAYALKRTVGGGADPGPPDPAARDATPQSGVIGRARGLAGSARATLRLANRLAEEWYRQGLVWRELARGRVVIFDRHFFIDFYAHDIGGPAPRRLTDRLHGRLLARLYPRPDLVIHLDAPPEVLLARKGEGTLESLARRRQEYVDVAREFAQADVVDATRPLDEVRRDVAARIVAYARRRSARRACGSWRAG
jgi:thymidylate kinase